MSHKFSRRNFLAQTSCAGLGYFSFMNTLFQLKALNAAAISNSAVADCSGYKAIVCILLAGGNDSYNMLVPYDSASHGHYATQRSNLAISRSALANTQLNFNPGDSRRWALHPSMVGMKNRFNQGRVAFLANIGTLLEHMDSDDYDNKLKKLPLGLFSHSDQIEEWQTGIPSMRSVKGWGGKMADLIRDCNSNQRVSMSISLSGSNLWQSGNETTEFAIDRNKGAVGIRDYDPETTNTLRRIRTENIDGLLRNTYSDIFEKTYKDVIQGSRDSFIELDAALQTNVTKFDNINFPEDNRLADSLKMVARTIDVRNLLGFKRQTFFITAGGWDHHDEVINKQNGMLAGVSGSLDAFQSAMGSGYANVENDVLTIIISEFGRTLSSNGNGSDHAWGGHTFVMGGPNLVDGQKIFGDYPSLNPSNPDKRLIRRGRTVPSTATDEYFAEVARWFGVSNSDLPILFPNIGKFYNTSSNTNPIGFLKA